MHGNLLALKWGQAGSSRSQQGAYSVFDRKNPQTLPHELGYHVVVDTRDGKTFRVLAQGVDQHACMAMASVLMKKGNISAGEMTPEHRLDMLSFMAKVAAAKESPVPP